MGTTTYYKYVTVKMLLTLVKNFFLNNLLRKSEIQERINYNRIHRKIKRASIIL